MSWPSEQIDIELPQTLRVAERALILVVEDSPNEQYALVQLLSTFDYDCEVASSGEQALEMVAKNLFEAVLMDLTLPGIGGIQCTRAIRRLPGREKLPIIGLTGSLQDKDRSDGLKSGMDDYLTKPFDSEDLRRILLRHVYDSSKPNLKTLKPQASSSSD